MSRTPCRRSGKTAWNPHALLSQLMLQRLAEWQHERFAAAIDAVELSGEIATIDRDIDDGAAAARNEAGHGCVGQSVSAPR